MTRDEAMILLTKEFNWAAGKFPPFASPHEGYAIIKEEVDELWEDIRRNYKDPCIDDMRTEAMQVAAMALRFMCDCT